MEALVAINKEALALSNDPQYKGRSAHELWNLFSS
jgi:hypothetical protein